MRSGVRLLNIAAILLVAAAVLSAGCSKNTQKKTALTKVPAVKSFLVRAKPVAPVNLTAMPGPGSVTLQWGIDPSAATLRPHIYRWKQNDARTLLVKLPPGQSSYIDTSAVIGAEYFYTVIFKTADGRKSDWDMVWATAWPITDSYAGKGASGPPAYGPGYDPTDSTGPRYETCPVCGGKGCDHCGGTGVMRVN